MSNCCVSLKTVNSPQTHLVQSAIRALSQRLFTLVTLYYLPPDS